MATKTRSVLEGRRLRFVPAREGAGYDVVARPLTGTSELKEVALGFVRRETASTDSKIPGTRLRRVGKGRTVWAAEPPRDEASAVGGRGARQIQPRGLRHADLTFDIEWRGHHYDTRADAAAILVEWHDEPERRRGPAGR